MCRPYAPFQAFYLVLLLVQWAGEGVGQLISLTVNSSRQLAGGVIALIFTVLTGSFPLLNGLGLAFTIISYTSFVRWGMAALLSVEFAPWYLGNLSPDLPAAAGCCHLDTSTFLDMLNGGALPVHCESKYPSRPVWPVSQSQVVETLVSSYGYTSTYMSTCSALGAHAPDIYPLTMHMGTSHGMHMHDNEEESSGEGQSCGWPSFRSGYGPADPGFSQSALVCLLLIGLIVRGLVYLSLRFTDRARRR